MKTKINLIMPMGGSGSRFSKDGFIIPKPLIEIKGKPFFYWATQSIGKFVGLESLTFIILQEHIDQFNIDQKIISYFPNANLKVIPKVLNGAVLTSLEGVEMINNEGPIVFNDCDHIFYCEPFYNYCNEGNFKLDGALLSFLSNDPKFSFLKYNEKGNVIRTVEKVAISNDAICGAYYFKNKDIFVEAAKKYLEVCNYQEFFMSGVYNILAEEGKIIKSFRVNSHVPFGTPEEYVIAEKSNEFERLK